MINLNMIYQILGDDLTDKHKHRIDSVGRPTRLAQM
jgi:hypothetical protein